MQATYVAPTKLPITSSRIDTLRRVGRQESAPRHRSAIRVAYKGFSNERKGVAKKLLAQVTRPGGVMDLFKSRLQELSAGEADEDLEKEDVD